MGQQLQRVLSGNKQGFGYVELSNFNPREEEIACPSSCSPLDLKRKHFLPCTPCTEGHDWTYSWMQTLEGREERKN